MQVVGLERFDDPRLAALVRRATELLEVEMGRSADRTAVEWSKGSDDRGRPTAVLSVSDPTASLEMSFTKDDLDREARMEGRKLIRFWGDFLQASSHKLLEPILASIRENEGL
jgi:hypothetical protein